MLSSFFQSLQGYYIDHPVGPVTPRDPLAKLDEYLAESAGTSVTSQRLKIAYAARWDTVPSRTWSGSAQALLTGLGQVTDIEDIGVHVPGYVRHPLRLACARLRNGTIRSPWALSRIGQAYESKILSGRFTRGSSVRTYDAALTIDSITEFPVPFFIYYDTSWSAMLATTDPSDLYIARQGFSKGMMQRRVVRQRAIYEKSAGILAMSSWFAKCLIQDGIPPAKVHVIHPGANIRLDGEVRCRKRPRRKLLYVGRSYDLVDFYAKGGDLLLDAYSLLRKEYDPALALTMVGVVGWPPGIEVPDGVTVIPTVPASEMQELYDMHDLFVLPTRRECFGISFVEAQARGLPCVGRNAYAMPEFILPGVSGSLINRSVPRELADAIATVLDDDELYRRCYERAPRIAEYFSWNRAAREIENAIRSALV